MLEKKDRDDLNGEAREATGLSVPGMLSGIRVVEVADELGEYCGLLLAGLGADVLKIAPPEGSPTRRIGPFYGEAPDPEKSPFFWNYNRAKRSIVLDPRTPAGRDALMRLLEGADVAGACNVAIRKTFVILPSSV